MAQLALGLMAISCMAFMPDCQESVGSDPESSGKKMEILFIGSSYFNNNDLPSLFKKFATAAGKKVLVESYCPSGHFLADHSKNAVIEAFINDRAWDVVILQGVGRLMAYPDKAGELTVYPALVKLSKTILDKKEDSKIVFCQPWAYEDGMLWAGGTDDFEAMQLKIREYTLACANKLDIDIAPVGWAWYEVLKEMDYPLHYLHQKDWNHPSLRGSYLMACVIFSSVFQESCVGKRIDAGLPEEEALHFQTVGSRVVLENLYLK